MSRTTDIERGAVIALDIAEAHLIQPDLFGPFSLGDEFWLDIANSAAVALAECSMLREAQQLVVVKTLPQVGELV